MLTEPAMRPADSASWTHEPEPASNKYARTVTLLSVASFAIHTLPGVSNTKPYEA